MAEKDEVILEKPEEQIGAQDELDTLKGTSGEVENDEELSLLNDIPTSSGDGGFVFTRDGPAPDEPGNTFEEVTDDTPTPWFKDKKFMSLFAGCVVFTLLLIFVLFYLSFAKGKVKPDYVATKQERTGVVALDESYNYNDLNKVDGLIHKANVLYLRGEVDQALKIYEQISIYNEGLSNYNLGVSKMNEGNFKEALEHFIKAIENGENKSVAAINAAVSSLKLGDVEKFKYYIDLAETNLSSEGNSGLYNYYLSLINFYKGYYPEALQMFDKTTIEPYVDSAKYLSAKIYTKLNLNEQAINALNEQGSYESSLSLGLLYARMSEWSKAKAALSTAMKIERDYDKALSALSFIDLKIGNFKEALERLDAAYPALNAKYKILDMHKMKTGLNKELFNQNLAQNNFQQDLLKEKQNQFDLIFYFAPYKVFDAKAAALYIKKANIATYLDDNVDTNEFLQGSKSLASTNAKIAQIINLALNQNLKDANAGFENLLANYPQHSILHYNLGLTYAQLKNYELAQKHFASAYHLNPRDYTTGAFALMAAKLSNADSAKLFAEILENINADRNTGNSIAKSMLFFSNDDLVSALPYLDENKNDTPLDLMYSAILAKANGLNAQSNVKIAQLNSMLRNDIISNILYFNTLNQNENIKEYAQNAQIHFDKLNLNYQSVFGGASIAREYYVSLMHISGLLNNEREKIKQIIAKASTNEEGVIQTLAYLDIFAGQFQEAYALYNTLIDDYKSNDSHTLFLAAVAATGAGNNNSAIALLELSKLKYQKNNESRAALGFLYHEAGNYEPAINQYKELPNNFKSKFFSFDING